VGFGDSPEIDHPDAATLPGAGPLPPNLPQAAGAFDEVTGGRLLDQVILQVPIQLVINQFF
jgi:hypothetical protein